MTAGCPVKGRLMMEVSPAAGYTRVESEPLNVVCIPLPAIWLRDHCFKTPFFLQIGFNIFFRYRIIFTVAVTRGSRVMYL